MIDNITLGIGVVEKLKKYISKSHNQTLLILYEIIYNKNT